MELDRTSVPRGTPGQEERPAMELDIRRGLMGVEGLEPPTLSV
jgi:hypothetical protein